jgi:hypothetical protein
MMDEAVKRRRAAMLGLTDEIKSHLDELERLAGRFGLPDPAPDPTGQFGEPWERHGETIFASPHDGTSPIVQVCGRRLRWSLRLSDRAVACVNALTGIQNVAAVPKLIDALRRHLRAGCGIYNGGEVSFLLAKLDRASDAEGAG